MTNIAVVEKPVPVPHTGRLHNTSSGRAGFQLSLHDLHPGLLCCLTSHWVQNSQAAAWARGQQGGWGLQGQSLAAWDCPTSGRSRVAQGHGDSHSPDNQAPLWGQVKTGTEHQPTFTGEYENLAVVCLELHVFSVGLVLKFSIESELKLH